MADTKERILMKALELFARDGYEAVSTGMIAGELGLAKSALYKHYRSKQNIFEKIVERLYALDEQQANNCDMPPDTFEHDAEPYRETTPESIRTFTLSQYRLWTEDPFFANLRRMLVLEQYRNPKMNELYQNCIVSGPVGYMEDIFRELMKEGTLREDDPKQLAAEFFAPMFLLISMSDGNLSPAEGERILSAQIDRFFKSCRNDLKEDTL